MEIKVEVRGRKDLVLPQPQVQLGYREDLGPLPQIPISTTPGDSGLCIHQRLQLLLPTRTRILTQRQLPFSTQTWCSGQPQVGSMTSTGFCSSMDSHHKLPSSPQVTIMLDITVTEGIQNIVMADMIRLTTVIIVGLAKEAEGIATIMGIIKITSHIIHRRGRIPTIDHSPLSPHPSLHTGIPSLPLALLPLLPLHLLLHHSHQQQHQLEPITRALLSAISQ